MKRSLLLLTFVLSFAAIFASPNFDKSKRYHIVCRQFLQGCVTDGATANQNTPIYHLPSATTAAETYWVFTEQQSGLFTIKNGRTGQYVTYDGVRQDSPELRRYISMTDATDGYNSLWSINQQEDGIYVIRNAQQTDHIWDVRVDSYCVGTYSNNGSGSQNQLFSFYDQQGQLVSEKAEPPVTEDGFDVSSWLDATTDSNADWDFIGTTWTDPSFGNYRNGIASVVSPFLERWHDSSNGPLPDGTMQQTLHNLPAGNYKLMADIIAVRQPSNGWWNQPEEVGTGVSLFANDYSTPAGTRNERPERYSVDFTLTDQDNGLLTLGIRIENTNANWVACDNFALYYQGTEEELLAAERIKVRAELADFYTDDEITLLINQCGDSFEALEMLRHSIDHLPAIDPLSRALSGLTIDGRALIWVESLNLYLCTLPLENFNSSFTGQINYTPREGSSRLTVAGKAVAPGDTYRFSNVKGQRTYRFSVTTAQGETIEHDVTFTSLPVVKLYGSFNNSYSLGSIIVHEPDKGAPSLLNMKAKWRGGITNGSGKNKRNYHVKLLDENGEKMEQKFFGLRNDNSWILESCQVDMSRIRNRVLTDLWNDYCTPPYYIDQEPKALSGSRGHFVELILNDEYRGIYCMTENMDRKQMKLKKFDEADGTIHGQLWKSKDWSYAVFMGHDSNSSYYPGTSPMWYDNWSEMWDQYATKYPDLEDLSPTDWSALYNAVNFVCTASDEEFREHFAEYFDLPVVIDYYILMETILSTDNHGKNMYFAVYDKQESEKVTLGVWDMDATCGQRWSDDYWHERFLGPEQDYSRFITNYEHGDYNLFRRLRLTDADDFNMQVRLRYRDLRQDHLATENILQRFRNYLDEFKTCGAAQREYDRWSYNSDVAGHVLDFDNEMEYLDDWFTRRMNYLDTRRFDIASLPNVITDINAKSNSASDNIVYDLRGQRLGTAAQLSSLPAGVYILNGKKIVVK